MEENQNNVVNNNQENDENKKKKKIVVWWNNLGKGVRTAICILGGVAVATAVVVPTVFGVKACTNTQRKYSVNSDEVNFTGKLENDAFEGTITVKDTSKEISNLVIKIGDYTLKDSEYMFDGETGKITISSDVVKAHNGDIVITPTVSEKATEIEFEFTGGKYELKESKINLVKDQRYFFKLDMSNFTSFIEKSFVIYTIDPFGYINAKTIRHTDQYMPDIKIKSNTQNFDKLDDVSKLTNPYNYAFNGVGTDDSEIYISKNSFTAESNYLIASFTCGSTKDGVRIYIELLEE